MFEYVNKEYIKNNKFKKTGLEYEEQEQKSYRRYTQTTDSV